jgi:hypothetical protein
VGKFLCDPARVTAVLDRLSADGKIRPRPDGKVEVKR